MTVTVSIVSHGHLALVRLLLNDLQQYCADVIEVIVTLNIPENTQLDVSAYTYPIQLLHNQIPKGFAANHNAAFAFMTTAYFCVMNPDIRLAKNPFPVLLDDLSQPQVGVVAPVIVDQMGNHQDSARKFPTPLLLGKRLFKQNASLDYDLSSPHSYPDWIAGMFMMFRREVYHAIQGFDEQFFLYCEDMDLCARLHQRHYIVLLNTTMKVIHDARRDSHRKLKFLYWHCQSLLRYFYRRWRGFYENE
jgi:N-acetylglucosaminyl-diphospho-decaprenol L-rhamnosyltransferase